MVAVDCGKFNKNAQPTPLLLLLLLLLTLLMALIVS